MRCKHPNLRITEYGTANTIHIKEDNIWYHESDVGSYTGRIWVRCDDCNLNSEYNTYSKYIPKWLLKELKSLGIKEE